MANGIKYKTMIANKQLSEFVKKAIEDEEEEE